MKRFVIGVVIAVALLTWLLMRQDLSALQKALLKAQLGWLVLAEVVRVLQHYLKAQRWGFAVHQVVQEDRPTHLFSATMIGFLGNLFFPARLGELLRVQIFQKNNPTISRSLALTCSLLAQMFDLMLLLVLLMVGIYLGQEGRLQYGTVAAVLGGLFGMLLMLHLAHRFFAPLERLLHRILAWFPSRLEEVLKGVIREVHQALGLLHQGRNLLVILLWTMLIWSLELVVIALAMRAFGFQLNPGMLALMTAGLSLAFLLPLTPGALGAHQMVAIWILARYSFTKETAMAFSLGLQAFDLGVIFLVGFAFFYREGLRLTNLETSQQEPQKPASPG